MIRQAFKFLGERYGWGHSYNGRDCGGFVDVRGMGVLMPQYQRASGQSGIFAPILLMPHHPPAAHGRSRHAGRRRSDLHPGHVMLFLGRINGAPYVIHDTNGGSYLDRDGTLHNMHLNGVSSTPLLPLRFDKDTDHVDRITNIVRVGKLNEGHAMKITDIRFGMLRVPPENPFQNRVARGRSSRRRGGDGAHQRWPCWLWQLRLHCRSGAPLHLPRIDWPEHRQPQPSDRTGAVFDGEKHRRQSGGGDCAV